MIDPYQSRALAKRFEEEHVKRVAADLQDASFEEIVSYFKKVKTEQEHLATLFDPSELMEVRRAIADMEPSEVLAVSQQTPELYEALKHCVKEKLFPKFPLPRALGGGTSAAIDDLAKELLRDLLSDTGGPKKAKGRKPMKSARSRDSRISRYFEIMVETTALPKGTNTDDKHEESCVEALAKILA